MALVCAVRLRRVVQSRQRALRADAAALVRVRRACVFSGGRWTNPSSDSKAVRTWIRQLGVVANATPVVFGEERRLGNLFDYCKAHANGNTIRAAFVLETLLKALGPLWPGRELLDGVPLGDCWAHPASSNGRVPFHKLTVADLLVAGTIDGGRV